MSNILKFVLSEIDFREADAQFLDEFCDNFRVKFSDDDLTEIVRQCGFFGLFDNIAFLLLNRVINKACDDFPLLERDKFSYNINYRDTHLAYDGKNLSDWGEISTIYGEKLILPLSEADKKLIKQAATKAAQHDYEYLDEYFSDGNHTRKTDFDGYTSNGYYFYGEVEYRFYYEYHPADPKVGIFSDWVDSTPIKDIGIESITNVDFRDEKSNSEITVKEIKL